MPVGSMTYAMPAQLRAVRLMCLACFWLHGGRLSGRGSTEKAEILDRLRYYRKEHGLGCLAAVAQRAGEGITDDTLRGLLSGDLALGIKDWRRIGRALDKLGTDQGEKKEA